MVYNNKSWAHTCIIYDCLLHVFVSTSYLCVSSVCDRFSLSDNIWLAILQTITQTYIYQLNYTKFRLFNYL